MIEDGKGRLNFRDIVGVVAGVVGIAAADGSRVCTVM
jgi:hypothetical protein